MKKYLISAVAAISVMTMTAQNRQPNVLDLKYSIEDSSIVYPESFEADTQKMLEGWYLKNYTTAKAPKGSDVDPGASDAVMRQRLADLPTVIDMPFNSIVKSYIERYTKKGRKQVTALLGLSSYYMPIFEQALEQAGLPMELKYLPVIESALNPNAVSKHGAAGLWQFIVASAKGYDMEVTSLVDERRDPYISSERACRLLKDLYNAYGDWTLAIAAYNCGPGTVNKALARAGGDPNSHDFWSIYYFLPAETRGYVPSFIAANYVMNYYPQHNIAPVLITKPLVTDTIHIYDRVHFNQIAAILDLPVEEIRILNPQFRTDLIPGSQAHPYNLILPSQQIHAYIVSEDQILAYDREKYARRTTATPGGDPNDEVMLAEELIDEGTPLNPADLAVAEQAAAELEYVALTDPEQQVTNPRRRRSTDTNGQPVRTPAASATPASNTKKTETPSTPPKKKNETAASNTKKADNTASNTKKNNKQADTASNTKKNNKKNDTASNNTKKNNKKKDTASNKKPSTHTVASGENLTVIAKKNGTTVEALRKANPNLKGDKIKPGEKLNVPKENKKKADNKKADNNKKKDNNTGSKKKKK